MIRAKIRSGNVGPFECIRMENRYAWDIPWDIPLTFTRVFFFFLNYDPCIILINLVSLFLVTISTCSITFSKLIFFHRSMDDVGMLFSSIV